MSAELTKNTDDSNLTLVERLRLRRQHGNIDCLLLDCSSSMAIEVEPRVSRHKALQEILSKIRFNGSVFWFNNLHGEMMNGQEVPKPQGNTYLAGLLTHIKLAGHKSCLVITDGEITDKIQTREAKKDLKIKVMFVGSVKPAFLDELASDGTATVEDLAQTKILTEKIQLLLAPPANSTSKGPIEL